MNNWISVKDKLPENNGEYLCVVKGRGCSFYYLEILEFFKKHDDSGFLCYSHDGYYEISNVTHWMALPKPPKRETE